MLQNGVFFVNHDVIGKNGLHMHLSAHFQHLPSLQALQPQLLQRRNNGEAAWAVVGLPLNGDGKPQPSSLAIRPQQRIQSYRPVRAETSQILGAKRLKALVI